MCGIAGIICSGSPAEDPEIRPLMGTILEHIYPRGKDTFGCASLDSEGKMVRLQKGNNEVIPIKQQIQPMVNNAFDSEATVHLFNFRGIPTTEYNASGKDLHGDEMQPYTNKDQTQVIVHNGLISNDKELSVGYQRLMDESLHEVYGHDIDSYAILKRMNQLGVFNLGQILGTLEGSWSFAATSNRQIHFARTFLGLWFAVVRSKHNTYLLFSSTKDSLLHIQNEHHLFEMPINGHGSWTIDYLQDQLNLPGPLHGLASEIMQSVEVRKTRTRQNGTSIVVIFSGGLDSTTVAAWAAQTYDRVYLLHFKYGCKAEDRETKAVTQICEYLNDKFEAKTTLHFMDTSWLKSLGGSSLTVDAREIAKGEVGAETISEWVPSRNLAFMGMTASFCDVHDIGCIALGLNREESAVFNDNSSEFFESMQAPLALGTQAMPTIACPLGNMMKSEIVTFAQKLNAPLHLSWSCYHGGKGPDKLQCGSSEALTCGPCLNTKRAFKMAKIENPIKYYEGE